MMGCVCVCVCARYFICAFFSPYRRGKKKYGTEILHSICAHPPLIATHKMNDFFWQGKAFLQQKRNFSIGEPLFPKSTVPLTEGKGSVDLIVHRKKCEAIGYTSGRPFSRSKDRCGEKRQPIYAPGKVWDGTEPKQKE
eukprot:TRINITY_DN336_c0_g1_i5.p1 TRINITY_DN336_c0_g1~~TRINITY_DN336_c0_g1_i5.p1  ORF type:complete len:138 (+),score=1.22 TRINITY_DN336_c0_g1_i5:233-646(+)